LMGFYLAEGSICKLKNRPDSYHTIFSFGTDEPELAKKVQRLIKSYFNIEATLVLRKTTLGVDTGRKVIAKELLRLGGKGARSKFIAGEIFNWPDEEIRSLIRSYWEGDGSLFKVGERWQASAGTTSYDLAVGLTLLLSRLGFRPTISKDKMCESIIDGRRLNGNGIVYQIRISKYDEIARFAKEILQKEIVSLERDFPLSQKIEFINQVRANKNISKSCRKSGWNVDGVNDSAPSIQDYYLWKKEVDIYEMQLGGLRMMPISGIKKYSYEGPVYNLTLSGDNTFMASQYLTHNCIVPRIESEPKEYDDFNVPVGDNPSIGDNNLLMTSTEHQRLVVDRLKDVRNLDINSGMEAALFTEETYQLYSKLHLERWRLAFDSMAVEKEIERAAAILSGHGVRYSSISTFVLIGFPGTTMEENIYRLEKTRALGMTPYPQRYVPLNSLSHKYTAKGFDNIELEKLRSYWVSANVWRSCTWQEFQNKYKPVEENATTPML